MKGGGQEVLLNLLESSVVVCFVHFCVLFWSWAIVVWGEWLYRLSGFFFLLLVISGTFGCGGAGFEGYLVSDSIRFVTKIVKTSTCSSAGFSLRCCSLAVVLALLLCSSFRNARACVWAGVSTRRVSSSSCIMPWEGSERACVNYNWSEALTGQGRVACLATFFAWDLSMWGFRRFWVQVGTMGRSGTWSLS